MTALGTKERASLYEVPKEGVLEGKYEVMKPKSCLVDGEGGG